MSSELDATDGTLIREIARVGTHCTDLSVDGNEILLTEEAIETVPDATLVRLAQDGDEVSTRAWGVGVALAVDARAGRVVVTGDCAGVRSIDGLRMDVKRVAGGALLDEDFAVAPVATDVDQTPSGHVFVVGEHGALLHRTP